MNALKNIGAALAVFVGYLVIPFFCLARAWGPTFSSAGPYPAHAIDCWSWAPLNKVYGNPEDGVSGIYAMIWEPGAGARSLYMPGRNPIWRACCWNYRNMANQLKRTWGLV
jgi:hypothetical protein